MKSKKGKKKIKKWVCIFIIVIIICSTSIFLYNTYTNIDINNSDYQIERVESTIDEQTVEKAEEKSKNVADILEKTMECVVGISKLKNTGSSIFSTNN